MLKMAKHHHTRRVCGIFILMGFILPSVAAVETEVSGSDTDTFYNESGTVQPITSPLTGSRTNEFTGWTTSTNSIGPTVTTDTFPTNKTGPTETTKAAFTQSSTQKPVSSTNTTRQTEITNLTSYSSRTPMPTFLTNKTRLTETTKAAFTQASTQKPVSSTNTTRQTEITNLTSSSTRTPIPTFPTNKTRPTETTKAAVTQASTQKPVSSTNTTRQTEITNLTSYSTRTPIPTFPTNKTRPTEITKAAFTQSSTQKPVSSTNTTRQTEITNLTSSSTRTPIPTFPTNKTRPTETTKAAVTQASTQKPVSSTNTTRQTEITNLTSYSTRTPIPTFPTNKTRPTEITKAAFTQSSTQKPVSSTNTTRQTEITNLTSYSTRTPIPTFPTNKTRPTETTKAAFTQVSTQKPVSSTNTTRQTEITNLTSSSTTTPIPTFPTNKTRLTETTKAAFTQSSTQKPVSSTNTTRQTEIANLTSSSTRTPIPTFPTNKTRPTETTKAAFTQASTQKPVSSTNTTRQTEITNLTSYSTRTPIPTFPTNKTRPTVTTKAAFTQSSTQKPVSSTNTTRQTEITNLTSYSTRTPIPTFPTNKTRPTETTKAAFTPASTQKPVSSTNTTRQTEITNLTSYSTRTPIPTFPTNKTRLTETTKAAFTQSSTQKPVSSTNTTRQTEITNLTSSSTRTPIPTFSTNKTRPTETTKAAFTQASTQKPVSSTNTTRQTEITNLTSSSTRTPIPTFPKNKTRPPETTKAAFTQAITQKPVSSTNTTRQTEITNLTSYSTRTPIPTFPTNKTRPTETTKAAFTQSSTQKPVSSTNITQQTDITNSASYSTKTSNTAFPTYKTRLTDSFTQPSTRKPTSLTNTTRPTEITKVTSFSTRTLKPVFPTNTTRPTVITIATDNPPRTVKTTVPTTKTRLTNNTKVTDESTRTMELTFSTTKTRPTEDTKVTDKPTITPKTTFSTNKTQHTLITKVTDKPTETLKPTFPATKTRSTEDTKVTNKPTETLNPTFSTTKTPYTVNTKITDKPTGTVKPTFPATKTRPTENTKVTDKPTETLKPTFLVTKTRSTEDTKVTDKPTGTVKPTFPATKTRSTENTKVTDKPTGSLKPTFSTTKAPYTVNTKITDKPTGTVKPTFPATKTRSTENTKVTDKPTGTKKLTFPTTKTQPTENKDYSTTEAMRTTLMYDKTSNDTTKETPNLDCGILKDPSNGYVNFDQGAGINALATFSCQEGFDLVGNASRRCTSNGEWDGQTPVCVIKDCNTPEGPANGFVTLDGGTIVNATATFVCKEGYNLIGDTTRKCTASGVWNGETPVCVIKDCGTLDGPANGFVTLDRGTIVNATARFVCKEGYNLIGDTTRKCTASGVWNGETPVCVIKDCGTLDGPANGFVTLDGGTIVNATATFVCKEGYNLTGDATRKCTASGVWNSETPVCVIKDCGTLDGPANGFVTLDGGTIVNATARFVCKEGNNLIGDATRKCTASGVWNGETPVCVIKDCGTLDGPANGFVTLDGGTFVNATARFVCKKGYNLIGDTTRKCTASGVWDSETPVCVIKDCGTLDGPANGFVTLDGGTIVNATATFVCKKGYNLIGDTTRKCTASGVWNGETPVCVIKDCGTLDGAANGFVTLDGGTIVNATATFVCKEGYNLIGDATRKCTASGVWDSETPVCVIKDCGTLDGPTNGFVTLDGGTIVNATATFVCKEGYNLIGDATRKCTASGVWNGETPVCVIKDCGTFEEPANGFVTLDGGTIVNATATFVCKEGYNLIGDATRKCTASGIWDSETPVCVIKDCGTLDGPANGFVTLDGGTIVDATATFVCKEGYNLTGDATRKCTASGVWNSETPVCVIKDCGTLDGAANGFVTLDGGTIVNATATFVCKEGYNLIGDATRKCTASGVWNGETPVCVIKDCGTLDGPANGFVTLDGGTIVNATATFVCNEGYNLIGDATRKCTASGVWIGETPVCEIKDCGALEGPSNGYVTFKDGTTFNAMATFSCEKGYSLIGNETSRCTESGEWDALAPKCDIKDCGVLEGPDNGYVTLDKGTTFNATATFVCEDEYILVGDVNRKCTRRGIWDGLTPVCVKKDEPITVCKEDIDGNGNVWLEVLVTEMRVIQCPEGYTGTITRLCGADGQWRRPRNFCVREIIKDIERQIDSLGEKANRDEVTQALDDMVTVTQPDSTDDPAVKKERLTEIEIDVLVTSLEKVVKTVVRTPDEILDENITADVIESTSNIIDVNNQESWNSLKQTDSNSGEKIMSTVDTIGDALCTSLEKSGKEKQTIVKKNVAFEVQKISENSKSDLQFPNKDITEGIGSENDRWLKETQSQILLNSKSLKKNPCSVTTVMYRNLSDILPVTTSVNKSEDIQQQQPKEKINAPILAMSISPPVVGKIDPPVKITFEHADRSLTDPLCAYWQYQNDTNGYWATEGCHVFFTNENYTICECDHLTNFAVLMSPFKQADASSQALRIISIIGISVSVICLFLTFGVHIYLWRYLRNDRTTMLMNLCFALLLSYIIFLAGVDRTESKVACTIIAAVLQYIYLVVFAVMLVEGIEIAVSVMYVFNRKSRIKMFLILAWVLPAVIVGISVGATQTKGYGNNDFCWLSVDNGVIWAFVGPALVIILFNVICIVLVMRAMFNSKTVQSKKTIEKIRTSFRSLCVLIPVMGISWLLGIFYINESFYFIQYIFAVINGLQGFFIFLIHCVLNKKIKNAFKLSARRKSSANFTSNNTSKDLRAASKSKVSKDKRIQSEEYTNEASENNNNKILQEPFPRNHTSLPSLGTHSISSLRRAAHFSEESRTKLIAEDTNS